MRETEELALENLLSVKAFFWGGEGNYIFSMFLFFQPSLLKKNLSSSVPPLLLQLPGRLQHVLVQRDASKSRLSDVTAGVRWPLCLCVANFP